MELLINALIVFIVILEMFLWIQPLGLKIFNQTKEDAMRNRVLTVNQGLHNSFIVALLRQERNFTCKL